MAQNLIFSTLWQATRNVNNAARATHRQQNSAATVAINFSSIQQPHPQVRQQVAAKAARAAVPTAAPRRAGLGCRHPLLATRSINSSNSYSANGIANQMPGVRNRQLRRGPILPTLWPTNKPTVVPPTGELQERPYELSPLR